jgi:hypothetical protein
MQKWKGLVIFFQWGMSTQNWCNHLRRTNNTYDLPNLKLGDVHKSLWIISKGLEVEDFETENGNLTCFPKMQDWQIEELGNCLHSINLLFLKEFKIFSPGCPKRLCHKIGDRAAKVDVEVG